MRLEVGDDDRSDYGGAKSDPDKTCDPDTIDCDGGPEDVDSYIIEFLVCPDSPSPPPQTPGSESV